MSDGLSSRSSSSISVTSSLEESVHSSISDDSQLNDHRHQNMSLPVRTDSRMVEDQAENHHTHSRRESQDINSTPKYVTINEEREPGVLPAPKTGKPEKIVGSAGLRAKVMGYGTDEEDGDDDQFTISVANKLSSSKVITTNSATPGRSSSQMTGLTKARSRSFSEQVKSFIRPKDDAVTEGILLGSNTGNNAGYSGNNNIAFPSLNRQHSRSSNISDRSRRRGSVFGRGVYDRANENAIDSDADSHASRESQETEEDVCFPMVPEHVRVRGIDFTEIEEFIQEQREETLELLRREEGLRNQPSSNAASKYTPEPSTTHRGLDEKLAYSSDSSTNNENGGVTFEKGITETIPGEVPDRFSFFTSDLEETIHAPDIPSLVKPGESVQNLFPTDASSTWWLDCVCPTDNEMKMLAKAFAIHPLTAEDIRMQETREKVELFKSYYFVCFHTFEPDNESEDFLEPINVYIVVFRNGILTFHFSPINNPANVRRRVRQLRDYVDVSADWLCYALIDDITDGFAPVIQAIEYEADAIEDSVFLSRENEFGAMLQRIGESRRKVMTLMRLLSGKADVIKMFAKRCQDEASMPLQSHTNLAGAALNYPAQPRGDIALYLGDIQDHIITMFQSLLAYEKIFSRSHANYLAQLQVESFYSNNKVTEMLSKVTLLGTILVPLNLVTGLFGMNVKIPGQEGTNLRWFFGIVGFIVLIVLCLGLGANYYLKYAQNKKGSLPSSGRSVASFHFGKGNRNREPRNRSNRSMISFPSKFGRYNEY